jgi:glucose-6-phosphate isomerase
MQRMLEGAHDIDEHFFDAPLGGNIPVLLGLIGVWNSTFMGYNARCLLPYSAALSKFPAMVQKLDMESNGKRVSAAGIPLLISAGEIDFGECGINGQYNFYQLLHQGRTVPADFIGFMESQSTALDEEYNESTEWDDNDEWDSKLIVSSHDELMSNFFSQPDALALGKTLNDLVQEEVPEELRQHKVFPGNRPSSSILMTKLDAFAVGQLFAIYEHRTVVSIGSRAMHFYHCYT